ncbi:transcriptional regulator, partial [Novosphingobium album (ex Liu et al. 2023)]
MDHVELQLAMKAFRRAVAWCGSGAAFARRFGMKQQTVSYRLKNDIPLQSAEEVLSVEFATGISRHELRPDIYPIETPPSSGTPPGDASAAANPRTAAAG